LLLEETGEGEDHQSHLNDEDECAVHKVAGYLTLVESLPSDLIRVKSHYLLRIVHVDIAHEGDSVEIVSKLVNVVFVSIALLNLILGSLSLILNVILPK
jgi:hypothetical protein